MELVITTITIICIIYIIMKNSHNIHLIKHFRPPFKIIVRPYNYGIVIWGVKLDVNEETKITLELCNNIQDALKGTKLSKLIVMDDMQIMRGCYKTEDEIIITDPNFSVLNFSSYTTDTLKYNRIYKFVLLNWIKEKDIY